mmetsp:Transcript_74766/g.177877  ORF Transcript_74766/g.177877 Transcript_74766/m.177877 type:complete len:206 (-) Transcript_74766:140-757(-)
MKSRPILIPFVLLEEVALHPASASVGWTTPANRKPATAHNVVDPDDAGNDGNNSHGHAVSLSDASVQEFLHHSSEPEHFEHSHDSQKSAKFHDAQHLNAAIGGVVQCHSHQHSEPIAEHNRQVGYHPRCHVVLDNDDWVFDDFAFLHNPGQARQANIHGPKRHRNPRQDQPIASHLYAPCQEVRYDYQVVREHHQALQVKEHAKP